MKLEELVELGLSEEQAQSVVGKYANMLPKSRFDEVNNAKKALEEQVNAYATQLEELKNNANGNEELQAQIQALQESNSTLKTEYEQKIVQERLNAALKLKLNGKVHDTDLALSLINRDAIKLDDNGNIVEGLDEQVNTLKEQKSFLFVPEAPQEAPTPQPTLQGWKPSQPPTQEASVVSIGAQMAAALNGSK